MQIEPNAVEPPTDRTVSELVFTVDNNQAVDELCVLWQKKEINMLHSPCLVHYGYNFFALG